MRERVAQVPQARDVAFVCVSGIWTNESGGMRSSADSGVNGSVRRRSQLDR